MEESNTTSSTTSKKTSLPLHEHELSTIPRQSDVSRNNETTITISEANLYKSFSELNDQQQSDEEQSETEYETLATKPKGSRLQKQLQAANGGSETDITDSASLLFTHIYEEQTELQELVYNWIESYKREPNGAMLELMRLIVRSSGCNSVDSLSCELLKSKKFTECINGLVEAFNNDEEQTEQYQPVETFSNDEEQTEQYPFVFGSMQFRDNLVTFIQLLVNECLYSIAYDRIMPDVFITFLIALADSQERAFRHTATLVVLKIMTALVDVLLSLSISKDANQRQYENERSKAASKRANDRIEMLTSKRKELEENEYEIQNFINFIFKAVFIHRYRDVCADIRCICINEIGEWMRKCAEKFLDDTFLKYIGWTLYDRVAECRLKCLQALYMLYEQDDLQAGLKLFTSRFKKRIVEMTLDRDLDVSVSAIQLLTIVSRNEDGLDLQKRYAVETMCCSVKQAATGEYPVSRRTQLNRKLKAKETKQVECDHIKRGKLHFIKSLPAQLTEYINDAMTLVYLLQTATHIDLNQYRPDLKLLKLVVEILSKHNDAALLDECSKLLCYFWNEETSIYLNSNVTRSSLLGDLVDKFTSAMRDFDQLNEVDENKMYPLKVALKRLAAFANNHATSAMIAFDQLTEVDENKMYPLKVALKRLAAFFDNCDIIYDNLVQNTFTILECPKRFDHELVERALTLARSIITWNIQKLKAECAASAAGEDADSTVTPLTQSTRDLIEYISNLSKEFYELCNKLLVNDNPQIKEEAYFELCDLLILFNINLISVNHTLVLKCPIDDINMLSVFVMSNVFSPEAATESAETAESIEKLHKMRRILASFCKLISYNLVPIKYAAEIFRGYVKYSASYGDIIKSLLRNCREISKLKTANTIAFALQREYIETVLNPTTRDGGLNRLDRNSVEFTSLKELARSLHFTFSFGPEARKAIVYMHHEAINYASESASAGVNQAPVNLSFLEILVEFSSYLTPPDKNSILNELDKKFAERANEIDENNWHPYYVYRQKLMEDCQHQQQQNHHETTAPITTTTSSTKTVFAAPSVPSSILRLPLPFANSTTVEMEVSLSQPLANSTAVEMSIGRRKETSFDTTGIARIKETRPRATAAAATAAVANDENIYDEENDGNLIDEQNLHADSTMNELVGLKLNADNSSASFPPVICDVGSFFSFRHDRKRLEERLEPLNEPVRETDQKSCKKRFEINRIMKFFKKLL